MSILLGPYERSDPSEKVVEEELLVFGYACKLYRDDAKALMEDSGQLLIPWMGDGSLMIDRYDVRNRLDDKGQFGLKSNLPYRFTEEEEQFEEMLDQERYLALECDELRVEEEEEKQKRLLAEMDGSSSFHAVGFSYESKATPTEDPVLLMSHPQLPEHPPTSSVDIGGEEDAFTPPPGLVIPKELKVPATNKLHSIIERTSQFISSHGTQMEIIIKAKQKFNPFFSFLDYGDSLNPYYRYLLHLISTGVYTPRSPSPGNAENAVEEQEDEASTSNRTGGGEKKEPSLVAEYEDSSDEESFELHPLLRTSLTPASSKPATPSRDERERETSSVDEIRNSSDTFRARSFVVNSAPTLESGSVYMGAQEENEDAPGDYQYTQQYPYSYGSYAGQDEYYASSCYDAFGYQTANPASYDDHLQSYYQALSANHISSLNSSAAGNTSGPTPPPPDLQPIVDKTAEYVARNSDSFERTVLEKHCGDPRFSFLNPWDQYHAYYQMKKRQFQEKSEQEDKELKIKSNVQKLNSSGAVSFKLQTKNSKLLAPKVDLSVGGEDEDEYGEEEQEGERGQNEIVSNGLEDKVEPPPAKRRRGEEEDEDEEEEEEAEGDKIGCKVQEFLSTVKAMFGTD